MNMHLLDALMQITFNIDVYKLICLLGIKPIKVLIYIECAILKAYFF